MNFESIYKQQSLSWTSILNRIINFILVKRGADGFRTFHGVFLPSILSIVGVILYLRLGWIVGEMGLGLSVNLSDINEAVDSILEIGPDDLAVWKKNLSKIPEKVYIYTDEHEKLAFFMKSCL